MVEDRSLLLEASRKIDRETGGAGKAAASFLPVVLGQIAGFQLCRFVRVAVQCERELAATASALRIVVEGPSVARAVIADRCGAKLPGYEGRDKRSAALVLAGNQSHGQPGTVLLAIEVQAEGANWASARARLRGPEKAKEDATAAAAPGQREGAGRAELILQRFTTDIIGIVSRLCGAADQSAHFAGGAAREMCLAVAEILRDRG